MQWPRLTVTRSIYLFEKHACHTGILQNVLFEIKKGKEIYKGELQIIFSRSVFRFISAFETHEQYIF